MIDRRALRASFPRGTFEIKREHLGFAHTKNHPGFKPAGKLNAWAFVSEILQAPPLTQASTRTNIR